MLGLVGFIQIIQTSTAALGGTNAPNLGTLVRSVFGRDPLQQKVREHICVRRTENGSLLPASRKDEI